MQAADGIKKLVQCWKKIQEMIYNELKQSFHTFAIFIAELNRTPIHLQHVGNTWY